jgi:hypothetical protein
MTALAGPAWRNLGRAWGLLFLAGLFGAGGYFLLKRSLEDWQTLLPVGEPAPVSPALVYLLYGLLAVLGLAKGEVIFRRKIVARTVARAQRAIGETGWAGDAPLAPFCLLSLYRPWQRAHAISSWLIIPLMIALAVICRVFLDPLERGPIYFGVGLALAYASLVYVYYLVRFLAWWVADARPETLPLPEAAASRRPRVEAPGLEAVAESR